MREPKRHHQVPRAYLERFAQDGKVLVRRRDGAKFETSPHNVAVESGYYDVTGLDGKRTRAVELAISEVEAPAWTALEAIDRAEREASRDERGCLWAKPVPSAASSIMPLVPQIPTPTPGGGGNCDPSYPDVCIPPYPPDLDCGDIPFRRFTVRQPDPHGFDADLDGIGCETG